MMMMMVTIMKEFLRCQYKTFAFRYKSKEWTLWFLRWPVFKQKRVSCFAGEEIATYTFICEGIPMFFCRSHSVNIYFHFTVFLESFSMRTLSFSSTVSNVDIVTFIVYGHRLTCYYSS